MSEVCGLCEAALSVLFDVSRLRESKSRTCLQIWQNWARSGPHMLGIPKPRFEQVLVRAALRVFTADASHLSLGDAFVELHDRLTSQFPLSDRLFDEGWMEDADGPGIGPVARSIGEQLSRPEASANRDKWIENHVLDQWLHLSRRAASHSYCYGRAPDVKLQREVVCAAHGRVDIVDGDGNGDS